MSWDMEEFLTSFGGDRARAYMFEWSNPPFTLDKLMTVLLGGSMKYLVKSTTFPESNVEMLTAYYQGIEVKYSGARRYSDWTVTLNCDPNSYVRLGFELYMMMSNTVVGAGNVFGKIVSLLSNMPGLGTIIDQIGNIAEGAIIYGDSSSIASYKLGPQTFSLKNPSDKTGILVILINSWIKNIGPISLDYSSQDVASFDVTFAYDYCMIRP